ncbi:hypothetical protein Q8W71_31300 [Methylobacterium sp. NEAU 140]|uniref:hypothetical protein n=1 Tax=Methylobacterium sp. NEAU 140 TaxID=3064945 RepID=UPI0027350CF2|nr:hypothetical protein [Methylobacterium sp. NEAU 140]MDP4027079.1 hypothetical protein [Methylobacterium sp. NEAU 140]
MTRPALAPEPVTAASVLALVQAIERHGPDAPAAIAFRSALRRKGIEADAAGGIQALDTLMDEIAEADPAKADARAAIIRSAWGELLPAPAGRTRP